MEAYGSDRVGPIMVQIVVSDGLHVYGGPRSGDVQLAEHLARKRPSASMASSGRNTGPELIRRVDNRLARYLSIDGHDFSRPPRLHLRIVDDCAKVRSALTARSVFGQASGNQG